MAVIQSEGALVAIQGVPSPAIVANFPGGISSYAGRVQAYEALYAAQPNVRTIVSFLGKNIAQLSMKLYEREDATRRTELYDHPAAALVRRPNHRTSRYSFFRAVIEDLGIFDNAVLIKVGDPRTSTRMLVRIPPQMVQPVGGNWLFPDGYKLLGAADQPTIPWEEVIHLHGYNPRLEGGLWGLSPIETLRRILAEDTAAGEWREQMWTRGARTTGYIERPKDAGRWSEAARARFREEFTAAYAGAGPDAGGIPVLEDGMAYKPAVFTPDELEYLGARKLTRAEVAAAYHVSPALFGITDGTAPGDEAAHRRMYQDAFAPLCQFVAEEFALQLLRDYVDLDADRHYYEHNLDEKLRGDFLAEAEATSRAVGAPYLTRNEARARRNLPPIDGGNELITPLNVTSGGRASPADTAPGTPGLGQAARGRKALELEAATNLPPALVPWVAQHASTIGDVVAAIQASALSRIGAGADAAAAMGLDTDSNRFPRWDARMTDAYTGLALEVAPVAAAPVAETFGVEYNLEVATPWLTENARIAAESFIDGTYAALAAVPAAEWGVAAAAEVFTAAGGWRAERAALDRVGQVSNFARHDAASQGGATTKTWRVTSDHPRASHAAMDGMTILAGERFPNGGLWPHDTALPAHEVAGCTCLVDFTEAPVSGPLPDV